MEDEKKAALEAALYVAEEPLDTEQIADVLNLGSKGYVQMVIDELVEDLEADNRGLEIIEEDGGYRMQVKPDYVEQIRGLAPHQDLAEATLRTLSIIAYNAPVKQSKIVDIRGNRAYNQIGELEDRGLLTSSKEGRTKVLDVTDGFLDYFNIESLDEFRNSLDAAPAAEELAAEGEEESETDSETEEAQGQTESDELDELEDEIDDSSSEEDR